MERSMIAAPDTKLNMPKFVSIQTKLLQYKTIYFCASHDTACNVNDSLIAILISLFTLP